jgi:hypothetical protein
MLQDIPWFINLIYCNFNCGDNVLTRKHVTYFLLVIVGYSKYYYYIAMWLVLLCYVVGVTTNKILNDNTTTAKNR